METSLIRVCDATGKTYGTGFVVSDSLAVTCAHVVEKCGVASDGRILAVFHANEEKCEAEVLSEFWRPPDGDDIAILRLLTDGGRLPEGVELLTLGSTRHCNGHMLQTAGFAALPGGYEFAWAEGRIRGVVPHPNKRPMLQMDAAPIRNGMSGAPVLDLDTQRVVGIVNEFMPGAPLEWATTSETLAAICPDLRLHLPQAVEDYLKAVAQFCRDLPYVSLKSDLPLETVYVRQQMRQEPSEGRKGSDQETGRQELATHELSARPMTVSQALEQHPRLVVMGGPGAGKSTLLRHLVQGLAEGTSGWHPHLPILVSLRGLAQQKGVLATKLGNQVAEDLDMRLADPLSNAFLDDWASQTEMPWLIALDGLDEIVDEQCRRDLIPKLKGASWPPGSRVVITTRSGTGTLPDGFAAFDLLPFEPEQVKEFAHNWFKPDEAKARTFLDSLQTARMGDLTGTPLLLTVAATVFEQSPEASPLTGFRRSKLYDEFVRILLDEDATPNRQMKAQFCQQFDPHSGAQLFNYRREVLESIALALQEGREVRDALVECLQQVVGWRTQDAAGKADDVLTILAQQRTGLVVRRGGPYEFIHPSFREYLAAAALVQACGSDLEKVWERIVQRWKEKNWREVALFALGVLSDENKDVTPLIERIWHGESENLFFAVDALAEQVRVTDDFAKQVTIALLALARDKTLRGEVRLRAARGLMQLGRTDEAASIMLGLVRDKVPTWIRLMAAQALVQRGWAEEIFTLARDETIDARVRRDAARGLVQLGRTDEAAAILLMLARSKGPGDLLRKECTEWLGALGRANELLTLACDPTIKVEERLSALEALLEQGLQANGASPIQLALVALVHDPTVEAGLRQLFVEVLEMAERIAQDDANKDIPLAVQDAVKAIRQLLSGWSQPGGE